MTTLDKAIQIFGFENPITITIATLEEQGKTDLAEQLFEECKELALPHWCEDDDEPLEGLSDEEYDEYFRISEEDLEEAVQEMGLDECGFDPYAGCYTFDC